METIVYALIADSAKTFAEGKISIANTAVDQDDPDVQLAISTIKNVLATTWFESILHANDTIVGQYPGPINVSSYTGADVKAILENVNFVITNDSAIVAHTMPNSLTNPSAGFTVYINPQAVIAEYGAYFTDSNEVMNWSVFHELGHSTPEALEFAKTHGYPDSTETPEIQAYANVAGAFFAAIGKFDYPEDAELDLLHGAIPLWHLMGGAGSDYLIGDSSPIYYYGGGGFDTADLSASNQALTANLTTPVVYEWEHMAFNQVESLIGSNYSDTLTGSPDNNSIQGGDGSDTISGGAGNDTLYGNNGDDWIHGNAGFDVIQGNAGNDTILGGQDGDTVLGGQGNDLIIGDAAADTLSGDIGSDTMTGAGGADTFQMSATGGTDVVTDFNRSEGDVVKIVSGTYTAYQFGSDTVVDLGGSNTLTLTNVNLASLTPGWIIS